MSSLKFYSITAEIVGTYFATAVQSKSLHCPMIKDKWESRFVFVMDVGK